ncbi:MAG TPA: MJ0042-type zinc finger domain-containing protein, partial [Gemmata sp.]
MESTVRATCPKCQTALRIPAQWLGRAVKCKKCGALVRTKAKDGVPPDAAAPAPALPQSAPVNAFDFDQPSEETDGFFGFPQEPAPAPAPAAYPAPAYPAPVLDANGYPLP